MYRMQGETSLPEVFPRVTKKLRQKQKTRAGGNLGANNPKQAKKSYHSPKPKEDKVWQAKRKT